MPGVTKHIYEADIRDIQSMWSKQLNELMPMLPQFYTESDIVSLLKQYYPHEWKSVEYKKNYYDSKDKYLYGKFEKRRYKMPSPLALVRSNAVFKRIVSDVFKTTYAEQFNETVCQNNEDALKKKRIPKIQKIDQKIENAKLYTQSVTPEFIDKIIGLYERKNASQKDRVYLLAELKKYYNGKVINFFFKLNDTEINKQLREMAFHHLQSFNYQPRLRKQKYMQIHTENRRRKEYLKNVYPNLTYQIPETPSELVSRISIGKEQEIKEYDFFISHSSIDATMVRKLIAHENEKGKYVFCDWINDSDYLKRNLLCEATLRVIEYRLGKSNELIFVRTSSSLNSIWCRYEINYYYELGKPMFCIEGNSIEDGSFKVTPYDPSELLCDDYKKLLFNNESYS